MHQPIQSSHEFAPHSLRFTGRIKEGSQETQDRIRWVRPGFETAMSNVKKPIRLDVYPVHHLKPTTN